MATETTNLGLTKPEGSDAPDIEVINNNMEIIDTKIKEALEQVELGPDIEEEEEGEVE